MRSTSSLLQSDVEGALEAWNQLVTEERFVCGIGVKTRKTTTWEKKKSQCCQDFTKTETQHPTVTPKLGGLCFQNSILGIAVRCLTF